MDRCRARVGSTSLTLLIATACAVLAPSTPAAGSGMRAGDDTCISVETIDHADCEHVS